MKSEIYVNAGRQYVEEMIECHKIFNDRGHKVMNDPTPVFNFVLLNGQEFHGTKWTSFRGRGYRKMTQRYCFHNAWCMSLIFDDLTYYEGFAFSGLLPVHHGWCVDSEGLVVDPTWRNTDYNLPEVEWDYFGVGFDSKAMNKWMQSKSTTSVLYDLDYSEEVSFLVVTA